METDIFASETFNLRVSNDLNGVMLLGWAMDSSVEPNEVSKVHLYRKTIRKFPQFARAKNKTENWGKWQAIFTKLGHREGQIFIIHM